MKQKFLEKDLEDIIFESDRDKLSKRGLHICGKMYRQVRIGNYGVADLISVNKIPTHAVTGVRAEFASNLDITIYELKMDRIDIDAFLQAVKYAKGISRYFEKHRKNLKAQFRIVLIGSEISKDERFQCVADMFTPDCMNGCASPAIHSVSFYKYEYDFNGIYFKYKKLFSLMDEGF